MRTTGFATLHSGLLQRKRDGKRGQQPPSGGYPRDTDIVPAKPSSRFDDSIRQMPFTQLARHRGELLPPGWGARGVAAGDRTTGKAGPAAPGADAAAPQAALEGIANASAALAARVEQRLPGLAGEQRERRDGEPASSPAELVADGWVPALAGGRMRKVLNLRLEPECHRKLKLASVQHGRSCQDLVSEAIDRYLETLEELPD